MVIYLNNAGTSWPKPPEVFEAVRCMHAASPEAWSGLFEGYHAEVATFFGIPDASRLMLTSGCTSALTTVLMGLPWQEGDRLITSQLEHHALSRHAVTLRDQYGVHRNVAPYAPGQPMDLEFVEQCLRLGQVRLVACTMASNVTGEVLPVSEIIALAHAHGALVLLDLAQTAGVVPIDVSALSADIVVFAGHKGPLGPQGIGGFYAASHVIFASPAASCDLRQARTGGCSDFPSYCDVGSVNMPALAGLSAGLAWLRNADVHKVRERTRMLTEHLLCGLQLLPFVNVYGSLDAARRTAVVSLSVDGHTTAFVQAHLAERGILTRGGFHCAPLAHEALKTTSEGTLRISFGPFNGLSDADAVLNALGVLG